ncbi:MAG: DUF448 domain-containing protein [Actinomycetota bacterium]
MRPRPRPRLSPTPRRWRRSRPTPEPQRTCIGCRRRRPQRALTRFALDGDGNLQIGRHQPGRGAWLCTEQLVACFDQATAARRWSRALRSTVSPPATTLMRNRLPPHRSSSGSR